MIEVRHLSKSFADNPVLKDVSTVFETGKCNLVIGRSGSGKTVFIKCLVGLLTADKGEILYDGRDFLTMTEKQQKALRNEIGMLFQGNALFDSMTVEDNIRFPLDMFTNLTIKEKLMKVNSTLEMVNLRNANKKYPSEISGGMMKRVGIARAIILGPKYLFCDEPNSGLDPKTAMLIDDLIKQITTDLHITTVMNTHDMNSVIGIGDKVVYLHEGQKHWEGPGRDVLETKDEQLHDFVFASKFLQEIRDMSLK